MGSSLGARIKRYKVLYVLLSFALIWTFVFCYLPMAGIVIAFQRFDIIRGFWGSSFVGFENFKEIFSMQGVSKAISNTLLYSSVTLFLGFPLPIILALLFNEIRHMTFKRIVQTITYMPHFLSWISVVALFYGFFELYGTWNDIRVFFLGADTERTNILMNPDYFLGIIFSSNVFKEIGWSTIIFLAAITGIDPQLYEAATVDGCGKLKQVLYITLPGILPTVMVIFILSSGGIISSNFEQVYGFQNLYTQSSTEVISTIVYKYGIQLGEFSMATAFGLSQGLVSFLILFVVNRISKRVSSIGVW